MEVNVRLFATLREGRFREQKVEVKDNIRVLDIINQYDIPLEDVAICLVNGRDAEREQALKNGDTVSIFPPVGGG